jgi:4-amino-4-deoxy-L-arabinose transferase-like glycosyltransferase
MIKKYINILWLALIAMFLYFSFYHNLGSLSIRLWDESRLANNAIEMYQDGDILVKKYNGKPEEWSTKPPLMVWFQVLSFKLFGINEFSLRLPSAIAGTLTSLLLLLFSIKILGTRTLGIFAFLILISSSGYIGYHVCRTGDNDALLILFTTIGTLSLFSHTETNNNKYLYIGLISFAFGILTKSIAALFFIPGIVLYYLICKKFISTLKNKHFYFSLILFITLPFSFYIIRNILTPGYLKSVLENEVLRFGEVANTHSGPFYMYFAQLGENLQLWLWLIFLFPVAQAFNKKKNVISRFSLFSFLLIISYLIIISSSQTKLPWYVAQIFPLYATLIATTLYLTYSSLNHTKWKYAVLLVFLFIFYLNFAHIYNKNTAKELSTDIRHHFGYLNRSIKIKSYTVVTERYNAPILFYVKKDILNGKNASCIWVNKKGYTATVWPKSKKKTEFIKGDTLIFGTHNSKKYFLRKHYTNLIGSFNKIEIHTYKGPIKKEN